MIHEFAILPAMTVQEFARQTYWYPILWFVFATGVAFGAAILFWKRGPATASGQIPGVPVTWKFSGAAAIFTVVLLIFYLINPLKSFSDYKKIVIIHSTQDLSTSPTEPSSPTDKASFTLDKSLLSSVDQKAIPFNSQTLQIELVPADSVYVLVPELTENSFRTNKPIPKGWYDIRFTSSETSQSRKYTVEVK